MSHYEERMQRARRQKLATLNHQNDVKQETESTHANNSLQKKGDGSLPRASVSRQSLSCTFTCSDGGGCSASNCKDSGSFENVSKKSSKRVPIGGMSSPRASLDKNLNPLPQLTNENCKHTDRTPSNSFTQNQPLQTEEDDDKSTKHLENTDTLETCSDASEGLTNTSTKDNQNTYIIRLSLVRPSFMPRRHSTVPALSVDALKNNKTSNV